MIELPTIISTWCDKHEDCAGCRFVGNECVVPSESGYTDWLSRMCDLIVLEMASD